MGKNERTLRNQFLNRQEAKRQSVLQIPAESVPQISDGNDSAGFIDDLNEIDRIIKKAETKPHCKKCDQAVKTREFAKKRKGVTLKSELKSQTFVFGDEIVHSKRKGLTGIFAEYTKSGRLKVLVDNALGPRYYSNGTWEHRKG